MDGPTPHQVEILVTWLVASGAAFGGSIWAVVDAVRDWRTATRRPPGWIRRSHVAQGRTNLVVAVVIFVFAFFFFAIGVLVVASVAKITLTGSLGTLVSLPPVLLLIQVTAMRLNRVVQRAIRTGGNPC